MGKYKIIILEGLPGVGKSTLTKNINNFDKSILAIDEIVYTEIFDNINLYQEMYFLNDDMKINKAINSERAIVDRGPISTLSYNQTRYIVDKNFDYNIANTYKWFNRFESFLNSDDVCVIYLTTNKNSFYLPYDNESDPYGSQDNQVLLEEITLYNCKKYCKNLLVIDYKKETMRNLIHEIINKYLCS